MYKKKRLINTGKVVSGQFSPFVDRDTIARPLSYYVNGGVDLDGLSTRQPVEGHYDSPEDIASGSMDITSDPTVSRMDIAEYAFARSTSSGDSRAAAKFVDTPDDNSD